MAAGDRRGDAGTYREDERRLRFTPAWCWFSSAVILTAGLSVRAETRRTSTRTQIPAAAPALDGEGHAVLVLEMASGDAAAVLAVVGLAADPAGDELPLGVGGVGGVCVWVEDEEVVDVEGPAGGGGAGEEAVGAAGAELEERLAGVGKVGEEDGGGLGGGGWLVGVHRGGGGGE